MKVTATLLIACICMTHAWAAEAAPFVLDWSAPEGCPSRERMLAATRARLSDDDPNAPPELFVRGEVTLAEGIVVVDLQVKDASGEDRGERRVRFDDRSCDAIETPTALVLAMMLGVARPRESNHAGEHPLADVPAAPAPSEPAPLRSGPAQDPPRPSPRPVAPGRALRPMTLGISAVASHGVLPNVGFGGALRWAATFWGPVVIGVEGSFETTWALRAANGEATFRRFDAAALVGVRVVRARSLEVVPLLEGRGGVLTGNVRGLSSTSDATSMLGSLGAGVLAKVPLGDVVSFEVLPDVRVLLGRDEFQVLSRGELIHVHRPAPFEARLSLGLAWELP